MRLTLVYMASVCLLFASTGAAQDTFRFDDPLSADTTFSATGGDSLIRLVHHFILPESVHILVDSEHQLTPKDYTLDPVAGVLVFSRSIASSLFRQGSRINISYRYLPLQLKPTFFHWTLSDTTDNPDSTLTERTVSVRPLTQPADPDFGDQLQKSGSIFRGISVGTGQGMRLQSGLRLQVSGAIAPRVDVVASLTDQNTPIQPEGNTQTLQEIDKVFVDLRAPGFAATMGDIVLNVDGSEFSAYTRKLQGASGSAETRYGSLTLSAAVSKGTFHTNYFMGREGNQGPYQLTGSRGQRDMIVLAGTERVWIDGEPMTRGDDNDYVIEYGNGQIQFTRNRLITDDSRITVDFEYSDQQFQKAVYSAVGKTRLWDERLSIRAAFLREADDKENPLDITLTDVYRQTLDAAGDHPDSAQASGARYVGPQQGAYVKVDSADVVFYRYAGTQAGDYSVRFSYVGPNLGDYSFQGYGIYRYEGAGRGSYLPVLFLPVPVSHQMVDLSTSLTLADGVVVEGEAAVSDQDLNLFSEQGDDDNVDVATSGRFRMDERPVHLRGVGLGRLGIRASMRNVGDGFRSVGRITEVEHGRKWGTTEGRSWGQREQEIGIVYKPFDGLSVEGETGFFRQGDAFRSGRTRLSTVLSPGKIPRIAYNAELIETERQAGQSGMWLRHRGSAEGRWKGLTPSLHYLGEHRRDEDPDSVRTGFRFDEWAAKLGFGTGSFSAEFSETIRDDQRYIGAVLSRASLARTDHFTLSLQSSKGFSSSLLFTHRTRNYTDPMSLDQKADLAEAKIHFSPGKRIIEASLNYRFSSTQIAQMVRDTIRVGEGFGNYRYDERLDEYVPDSQGAFLFRNIQTDQYLPVNDLKAGAEIRVDAGRMWGNPRGFQRIISALRLRTLIRVERRDRERDFARVNRQAFVPRWGGDSTTVTGALSIHQDLEYAPRQSSLSIRLRLRSDDSEDNQLMREGLLRRRREQSLRVKGNPLRQLGILAEVVSRSESKTFTSRSWSNRDITGLDATLDISYRPKQQIELAVKGKVRRARDDQPDPATQATALFLLPRVGYAFRGRGHLRAELEIGDVRSEPKDAALPYEMLGGDQPGRTIRWSVLMTYRVSGYVQATFTLRGRKEPWRQSVYHIGQVEVRAFF